MYGNAYFINISDWSRRKTWPTSCWYTLWSVLHCTCTVGPICKVLMLRNALHTGNKLFALDVAQCASIIVYFRLICVVCWAVPCLVWDQYWPGQSFAVLFPEIMHCRRLSGLHLDTPLPVWPTIIWNMLTARPLNPLKIVCRSLFMEISALICFSFSGVRCRSVKKVVFVKAAMTV